MTMTPQQIFDRVVHHLLTQGRKAMMRESESPCRYRGSGGSMCAVGCLIADECYDPNLEGKNLNSIEVRKALFDSGVVFEISIFSWIGEDNVPAQYRLLARLQSIHDRLEVFEWPEALKSLAGEYGLNIPAILQEATPYDDTKITSPCGEWQVGFHAMGNVDRTLHTGWFEWVGGDNSDREITGELIFEIHPDRPYLLELIDYDGVFALPQPVAALLIQAGVFVSSRFIDGDDE